ncbi:MAG TPA: N-acetylmuramoyl-L-alanine amidase [Desulfosporosinus sp.]|nr:N-acetylmuramoyl-L-alanine amidase [Desulfosporosinus sp.]
MHKYVRISGNKTAILLVLSVMSMLVVSVLWQGSTAVVSFEKGHIVMLDPGHGGYDPGAITNQGVYEKSINLQIAQKVKEMLGPSGIGVFLTREEDIDYVPDGVKGRTIRKQIDLNRRIDMAKEANADLFVSLHVNATATGQDSGAETFYHSKSETGKRLAELIQQELIKIPGMNRRIVKPGDFYIINNTSMPAVIVEVGYLSSLKEQKKLQQSWYQEQLARAIAKGIANFFVLP